MSLKNTALASILTLALVPACGPGDDTATTGSTSTSAGGDAGGGGQGGGAPADATLVVTDKGPVKGTLAGDTREFFAIPYAAPPVGALRWRSPQPAAAWTAPVDATKRGPACPQFGKGVLPLGLETSEDCLSLNVWSPKAAAAGKAPVLLWIHGGGFTVGSGAEALFESRALAEKTGAVVVTFNYRLGPLGFLGHASLVSAGDNEPSSGNYGIEDQRAAMAWVKNNIAAFGGDPQNVTLFGESAGSISVCGQIASPLSKGLFSKAIMESGSCTSITLSKAAAQANADKFAAALGCADPNAVVDCMRSKSVDEVLTKTPVDTNVSVLGAWGPVIDGATWTQSPAKMLAQGDFNHVPTLLGTVRDEGSIFAAQIAPGDLTEADYTKLMQTLFGPAATPLLAIYPASAFPTPKAALANLLGDVGFTCPARQTARAIAKDGTKTFLYSFNYDLKPPQLPGLGVFHGSELPFVFAVDVLGATITGERKTMSDEMMTYWGNFAKQGDPNGGGQVAWPSYQADADQHLELNVPSVAGENLKRDKCDALDQFMP